MSAADDPLVDPVGCVVTAVAAVDSTLDPDTIGRIVEGIGGGRARRRRLAAFLAADASVLVSGRSPAPMVVADLLVALRAAGAGGIALPRCATCVRGLTSVRRHGQDWYCSVCVRLRSLRACASCGRQRPVASRDRAGQPRCDRCPDRDERDPLTVLVGVVTGLDFSLSGEVVADAAGRVFSRQGNMRRLAWAVQDRLSLLTGDGAQAPIGAVLRLIDELCTAGAEGDHSTGLPVLPARRPPAPPTGGAVELPQLHCRRIGVGGCWRGPGTVSRATRAGGGRMDGVRRRSRGTRRPAAPTDWSPAMRAAANPDVGRDAATDWSDHGWAPSPAAASPPETDGRGLSSSRAAALLAEVGPNTIPERRPSALARMAGKLWAPVPWMLEATIVLEVALGKWLDAGIVAAVLCLNAAVGFVQEGRAAAAVALLRSRLAVNARVCRGGAWTLLPAADLVPGDLVHVRAGDLVSADLHLDDGGVLVDQSTLTGESVPVERSPGEDLYSGSTVARGEASGVVTATGTRTYFGRTAELVGAARAGDHLGAVVLRMVRVFILVDMVLAAAGTAWLAVTGASGQDVLSYAVVLLLASVPVALPAAFALAGALGAQHLAGLGIVTTRLPTLQDAAGMDVLCVDKTGTITANRLTVTQVAATPSATEIDVLRLAAGACDEATQDPIDLAILHAAAEHGLPSPVRSEIVPFDPATKRSEATLRTDHGSVRVTKGAPQVIAVLAGQPPDPQVTALAGTGARVLAVAVRDSQAGWRPVGLLGLADPPRPDAATLIHQLHDLGVRVVMLTGDTAATATAVAAQVGIPGPVVRAAQIGDHRDGPPGFAVVAEVLPEDKHRLVRRLQTAGHVVGMTGDGVNDAPALRQAEVGIAVAGATDVAKSAAGAVLTREGLVDIVGLVQESRRIHQRSLTYALNVSVKKIEVPLLLAIGVFAWRQFVFTPLLMALLLLGNDVVSMAITTDRADYARRPDRWNIRATITGAVIVAAPLIAASVGLLWVGRDIWPSLDLDRLRTLMFVTLIVSSQATIYLVRTRDHAWTHRPGRWLITATILDITATLALALTGTLMAPLPPLAVLLVVAVIAVGGFAADTAKVHTFKALGLHRLWRQPNDRTDLGASASGRSNGARGPGPPGPCG